MPQFSNTAIILFLALCAFIVVAKLLKVEKGAIGLGLAVVIIWLALHFTGYDKTIYHILFEAPPVQQEDYRYR